MIGVEPKNVFTTGKQDFLAMQKQIRRINMSL